MDLVVIRINKTGRDLNRCFLPALERFDSRKVVQSQLRKHQNIASHITHRDPFQATFIERDEKACRRETVERSFTFSCSRR